MESDRNVIIEGISNGEFVPRNKEHTMSLLYVRVVVCLIIFGGVIFVKLNNPCFFENCRFWYQNNVCEEKITADEIKQAAVSALFKVREKILNIVSELG